MSDEFKKPSAPKSAIEIAGALARKGTIQEAMKAAGFADLREHLPMSMRLEEIARQISPSQGLLDALKRTRGAKDALLTEALKHESLAEQLKGVAMSEARPMQQREPDAKSIQATGVAIQSVADIGSTIRTLRKAKGLNQQEFADHAGVGRRFLSELESGKPTLEIGKVLKVAAAAGFRLKMVPVGQSDD